MGDFYKRSSSENGQSCPEFSSCPTMYVAPIPTLAECNVDESDYGCARRPVSIKTLVRAKPTSECVMSDS